MDTQLVTQQVRLTQWAKIIEDRIASGMKVDEYCDQHQLSRNAYFYWLRKVKEQEIRSSGVQFAELVHPTSSDFMQTPCSLSIQVNQMTVNVNGPFQKDLLKDILEVVSHVQR